MPLTDAELAFLDAYVHELYSAPMTGPHSRALRGLGASQWDLSWLLTAWHRRVLGDGKESARFFSLRARASALVFQGRSPLQRTGS